LSRLFSRLLRRLSSATGPRTHARRARPAVELLEDRLTPTVFFQPQLGAESPVPGHNGPTLSNTPVHLIFEGSYWENPTGITEGDVIQSVSNILTSSYLSYTTQYGTNGHAYLVDIQLDTSLPLTNGAFAESDLRTVAAKHVNNNVTFASLFNLSARDLYLVITAPGVTDGTNPDFGGYHDELTHLVPIGFGAGVPEEVPFGHVGISSGNRQDQLDSFSQTFGHELVESMTDPYIRTHDANRFYHGKNFTTNESYDEVADFEPNDGRYTYRLGNGTLVQAYWSQKDQQFVVPDGTVQTFTLAPQYATPPGGAPDQSNFEFRYNLTVNGDQLAGKDDRFTVEAVTSGLQAGGVRVTLNGEAVTFDGQIRNLTLNTGTGDDAVDIESLPAFVGLTVNLGGGHDAVTLGQVGGQLDGLAGAVTINGGGANSTLTVNDAATGRVNLHGFHLPESHSVAWSVTGNSLSRTDTVELHLLGGTFTSTVSSNVTYSGLGKINLFSGPCPNTYDLQTDKLSTPLAVHGAGTDNALTFDDSARSDNVSTAYTVTARQVIRVGTDLVRFGQGGVFHSFFAHYTAAVAYAGVQSLFINGGLSGNTITVHGTGSGTATTIDAGSGTNKVAVFSSSSAVSITGDGTNYVTLGAGGSLALLDGPVDISNTSNGTTNGTSHVTIDDGTDTTGQNYTISSSAIAVQGRPTINLSSTVAGVTINDAIGQANSYTVDSVLASDPVTINGDALDTLSGQAAGQVTFNNHAHS
jgi:hypothetical protein